MKKMEKETFQFKLSNWHYKISIDGEWVNCGMIESKGYPALALAPQIAEIQKVLPGYTYTTSRDSLWKIFAFHTTDDGSGDEVEFSIELNSPGKRGGSHSCSCEQDSKVDNVGTDDPVAPIDVICKLYDGTLFCQLPYSTTWIRTGNPSTSPPDISTMNTLLTVYVFESYLIFEDAVYQFAKHQGSDKKGDNEPFTIQFNVMAEFVTVKWAIAGTDIGYCEKPDGTGERTGQYYVWYQDVNQQTAGCVQYRIPSGRVSPWVYPPDNGYLNGNCPVHGLSFQGNQYDVASPIFWSHSGLDLKGMGLDSTFSVAMTKTKTNSGFDK